MCDNNENHSMAEKYLLLRLDEVQNLVPRGKVDAARALMHGLAASETRGSDYFTSTAVYWGACAWIEEVPATISCSRVLKFPGRLISGCWRLGKGCGSVQERCITRLVDDAGVSP